MRPGDFLDRIADLARGGTYVSAILPRGYLDAERPKRRVEIAQRFTIIDREDWPDDIFMPLTKISTTLYLLTVKRDGPLVGEVLPRGKAIGVSAKTDFAAATAADPAWRKSIPGSPSGLPYRPFSADDAADDEPDMFPVRLRRTWRPMMRPMRKCSAARSS